MESPHSKGSWRVSWVSCYKTPDSAEERGMEHSSRRFTFRARSEIEERSFAALRMTAKGEVAME
jgi:hypothetical protein